MSLILAVAVALSVIVVVVIMACELWPLVQAKGPDQGEEGAVETGGSRPRRPWNQVHNWVYWLDEPDLEEIRRSAFELAVIDYSADGSAAREFTGPEIDRLRHEGCQRRVLAYLSIGEAEDYRGYWQETWRPGAPAWIVAENPDWEGNYLVTYWSPEWQKIVFRYLDRIIEQGFDGVYLDRVDAYADEHVSGHEQDMVDFVLAVARHARERSPLGEDFGIIVQNAEELALDHPDYLAEVTGIGREETYFEASNQPTPASERAETEAILDLFLRESRAGLVLTVDYADQPELVSEAYGRAFSSGYVPYVTDVGLDSLRINPGFEPICRPLP
jgi:cysteinyl-tRNA synthetase